MRFLIFFLLLSLFYVHADAQQNRVPKCILPGNNFVKLEYQLHNGDTIFRKYDKRVEEITGTDTIVYIEQFDVNREWYVYRYKMVNGKTVLDGLQQQYDLDGNKIYESYCGQGNVCDRARKFSYFPNGQMMSAVAYSGNKLNGISIFYHNNGQLKHSLEYIDGRLWNVVAYFDQNGNPLEAGNFCDGNGTLNVYSSTGKLIRIKVYRNGKVKHSFDVKEEE